MLRNMIKAKPRAPGRHRKKFAWYIAQDEKGNIYTARTMKSLANAINRNRDTAKHCHAQHLYRVASGHQIAPHKGVCVRRLDSEQQYDQWKHDWLASGNSIYSDTF